jgi:formylglycine-generating enzyme required for sulfatase activity
MDLYELTREDLWTLYREHAPDEQPAAERIAWDTESGYRREETRDWPAFLTWHEAVRVAGWRGMRLPTALEWIHVAVGRRGLRFPWGKDQSSVANTLEMGVSQPTPVGTFESGRSQPFGCYDMVGNVWEWVADAVPGYYDDPETDLSATPPFPFDEPAFVAADSRRVSAMGGAFNTRRRATYGSLPRLTFNAQRLDQGHLSPEVGVRMCADAETYLWESAPRWGTGEGARQRVVAVGRAWSEDRVGRDGLAALLDGLLAREGAPPGLLWLREGVEAALEESP